MFFFKKQEFKTFELKTAYLRHTTISLNLKLFCQLDMVELGSLNFTATKIFLKISYSILFIRILNLDLSVIINL